MKRGRESCGWYPALARSTRERGNKRMAYCGIVASKIRNPKATIRNSFGFAYVALIVAIVIIGISLGAAGKFWSHEILRDKEEELLFRGDQYRIAIERYYYALPGRPQYPPSIDDLLKDNRTPTGKRHLRQQYKDPVTNEDFVLIQDQLSRRIIGVHSASDKTPLKQSNFPQEYTSFEGKERYSDWQFLASIKPKRPVIPGQAPSPDHIPTRP